MQKHGKQIFSDCDYFLKRFNEDDYKYNMNLFRKKWNDTLIQTIAAHSYEDASLEFVQQVKKVYTRFGRISKARKRDLGLFMIYFLFPAILLTECEGAKIFCDVLLDTWNRELDTSIVYMDYEEIAAGFNDKLLGMMKE